MAVEDRLSKRQKIGLAFFSLGLIVSLLLMFFAERQWESTKKRKLELKKQTGRLAVMKSLEQQQLIMGNRFEKLVDFFPAKEEEVAQLAQKLETVAKNTGVELKLTFEDFPEKIDIGGQYQKGLGINAEIKGSYQGLASWVRGIQQLPYFLRFSEFKIGTLEELAGVRAEFKGIIFLRNVN